MALRNRRSADDGEHVPAAGGIPVRVHLGAGRTATPGEFSVGVAAPPRIPTSWRRRLCGGRRRRGQWGALAPPSGAPVRGPHTSSVEVGGAGVTSAACRQAYDVFAPSGRRI